MYYIILIHTTRNRLCFISDKDFWNESNEAELLVALQKPNVNVAKNLVLAIGDGMDVTTTTGNTILVLTTRYT